jgi:hypothetical protein
MPTIEPLRALDTLPPMLSWRGCSRCGAAFTEPESHIDLIVGRLAAIVIQSLESRWQRANRASNPAPT